MEVLPNEVIEYIKDFVIFKPTTRGKLRNAINLWNHKKKEAIKKYGHISNWNVSLIFDMTSLFYGMHLFNEDINNWDVSNVTNMDYMFYGTYEYNKPLDKWDVSNVVSKLRK